MYKRNLFCLILYPFHCWDDDVWALGREQSSICHRFQLSAIQGQEQNGAERRKRRRRRIVIVGDDRAELYTSDAAMANETRVKEETQQLKSFWQTTMRRRRKVEVSNGHTTAEKRDRDVLIKDAQSRAAPPPIIVMMGFSFNAPTTTTTRSKGNMWREYLEIYTHSSSSLHRPKKEIDDVKVEKSRERV